MWLSNTCDKEETEAGYLTVQQQTLLFLISFLWVFSMRTWIFQIIFRSAYHFQVPHFMCVMQGPAYIGPGLDLVSTPQSLGLDTLWSWS